jgi:hypothetical protein
VEAFESDREMLMRRHKPGTEAGQRHFQSDENRWAMGQCKGHNRICFLAPTFQEKESQYGIQDGADQHGKKEQRHTLRRAINIGVIGLAKAAKPLASAIDSKGGPESSRQGASVN